MRLPTFPIPDGRKALALATLLAALLPITARALIMVGGDTPIRDPGFPAGAREMANLPTRHSYWEGPPFGGGAYHFNYTGDDAALERAAETFVQIGAPELEAHLYPGPHTDHLSHSDDAQPVDWTFVVWVRGNYNRVLNDPRSHFMSGAPGFREPVPPPTLNIYLAPDETLPAKVRAPLEATPRLRLVDHRASSLGIETDEAVLDLWVLDATTSRAIPSSEALLRARGPDGWTDRAQTPVGADGRTRWIAEPSTAPLSLQVRAPKYATRSLHIGSANPDQYARYALYLEPAVTSEGRVVDPNGAGIPEVRVQATTTLGSDGRAYTMPSTPETITDAEGRFRFEGLPRGYAHFRATASGYHSLDPIQELHVTGEDAVQLRLSQAGRVAIVVTNAQGQPISQFDGRALIVEIEPEGGAAVGRWGASGQIDPTGRAAYQNIPPGTYRAQARPNPGSPETESTPEVLFTIQPNQETNLELRFSPDAPRR